MIAFYAVNLRQIHIPDNLLFGIISPKTNNASLSDPLSSPNPSHPEHHAFSSSVLIILFLCQIVMFRQKEMQHSPHLFPIISYLFFFVQNIFLFLFKWILLMWSFQDPEYNDNPHDIQNIYKNCRIISQQKYNDHNSCQRN